MNDLKQPVTNFVIDFTPILAKGRGGQRAPGKFENSEGLFVLTNLRSGQWEIVARDQRDLRIRSAPVVITMPTEDAEAVITLPRPATLIGHVLNPNGDPLPGASVHLWLAGADEPFFSLEGSSSEADARTDDNGRFRVEMVQPGDLKIMARHPDHSDSVWEKVAVLPGQTLDDIRITLSSGGRIVGLVDAALGSVANREVSLFSGQGGMGWRNTKTDGFGRFVIENVIPQQYVIELRPPGYPDEEKDADGQSVPGIRKDITVKNDETTEVFFDALKRPIIVSGTVRSLDQSVPGITVSAGLRTGSDDRGEKFTTGSDGRYRLTLDGPGEYTFSLTANYGSHVWLDRTVPDLTEVEFDFDVPSGAITGRVFGAKEQGLSNVGITLLRVGFTDTESFYKNYRRAHTGWDGSFEFKLLPPGEYVLRTPDGFQWDQPPPRVPYGRVVLSGLQVEERAGPDRLDIRLPPEGRIAGQVLDPKGNALAGTRVRVNDSQGLSLSAQWERGTDATGHFLIENVAAGTYVVLVRGSPDPTQSESIVVEAGKTATTKIVVR